MKEGFRTDEDILREVAKEEGMTIHEIRDVWLHQRKYINKLQEEEGIYAIFLPYIGTLSLNVKQFKKELRYKNKPTYTAFIEKVNKLENDERYKKYGNAHKKTTGIHKLTNYIINNYKTDLIFKKVLAFHKECWSIIEKYSNDVLEKKDKNELD